MAMKEAKAKLLQWGRDQLIAELGCTRRENYRDAMASMGPRSIDRGTLIDAAQATVKLAASMGPRSIDRGTWRDSSVSSAGVRASMGPRSIDRGTQEYPCNNHQRNQASMGPRSIDRGTSWDRYQACYQDQLQWGRDQLIAELRTAGLSTARSSRFNGAAIN